MCLWMRMSVCMWFPLYSNDFHAFPTLSNDSLCFLVFFVGSHWFILTSDASPRIPIFPMTLQWFPAVSGHSQCIPSFSNEFDFRWYYPMFSLEFLPLPVLVQFLPIGFPMISQNVFRFLLHTNRFKRILLISTDVLWSPLNSNASRWFLMIFQGFPWFLLISDRSPWISFWIPRFLLAHFSF